MTTHATIADTTSERPTSKVLLVSADTAHRWMERNVHNRRLDPITVEKYRRDMAAGKWMFAADPIRFDVNGNLLDGQHRLAALAQCDDLNLPLLIVTGLPPETQQVMDSGKFRLAGQQLQMDGIKYANTIAAAVKLHMICQDGLLFKDNKQTRFITTAHIQQWVAANPDAVTHAQSVMPTIKSVDVAPKIGGAAALTFFEVDEPASVEFFQLLRDGAGTKGHPIVTLDKKLQHLRRHSIGMSDRDLLAFFFLAWNAWRDGREMAKFQRPRGGKWSVANFPWPR